VEAATRLLGLPARDRENRANCADKVLIALEPPNDLMRISERTGAFEKEKE